MAEKQEKINEDELVPENSTELSSQEKGDEKLLDEENKKQQQEHQEGVEEDEDAAMEDENEAANESTADAGSTTAAASVADDDGDNILTLEDLICEEQAMEQEYAAVLGASDSKRCTYSKGYIKRQALYACLTCTPAARTDPKKRAGVCLACSYNCHVGHEMVELYTKRNFRCDCGTAKILAVRCRLDTMKLDQNDANQYNQNFSGVYCSCHRPYPDPEDPIDDEMIQCVICEDWYHCRHLVSKVPTLSEFTEMICGDCMAKHTFLQNYTGLSILSDTVDEELAAVEEQQRQPQQQQKISPTKNKVGRKRKATTTELVKMNKTTEDKTVNVDEVNDEQTETTVNAEDKIKKDSNVASSSKSTTNTEEKIVVVDEQLTDEINKCIMDIIEINKANGDSKTEATTTEEKDKKVENVVEAEEDENNEAIVPTKRQKLSETTEKAVGSSSTIETTPSTSTSAQNSDVISVTCKKPKLPENSTPIIGATFWPHDWRYNLCECTNCTVLLRTQKLEFLLDQEDTVLCYQEKGLAKMGENSMIDREMAALAQLDHVGQIEFISGYNKLKEKLKEFLDAFVTNQQVITEDDVNRFFRMMKEKKDNDMHLPPEP